MKKLLLLFLALIVIVITGCSNQPSEKDRNTIKVAHFPNITHSQALVGRAEGQFQKALGDTKIEWKHFNAGPEEIEAFLAGEVDLGYIGPGPAVNGYVKSGGELQIIAGASNGGAIFISRKDVSIKDLKELKGKKIAVPQFGNTQDLTLRKLLADNGLKDAAKGGNVEIIQAKNPDIKTLLDNGHVDAAFVPEPWGSRLIKEVGANIILDNDQILNGGNYSTAVVIVRKTFLEQNPDVVEKFLRTHVELTENINTNLKNGQNVVNAEIKELTQKALPEDVLTESFKRLTVTYDPEIASIDEFVSLSTSLGYLKGNSDVKELYNIKLLNKILLEKNLPEIK